jgi:hypothetical protein
VKDKSFIIPLIFRDLLAVTLIIMTALAALPEDLSAVSIQNRVFLYLDTH